MSLPGSVSQPQKQGMNVYTVMLIIAFCAIVTGCILLAAELKSYGPGVPWNTAGGS